MEVTDCFAEVDNLVMRPLILLLSKCLISLTEKMVMCEVSGSVSGNFMSFRSSSILLVLLANDHEKSRKKPACRLLSQIVEHFGAR